MRVTTKGQVTIPQHIREKLGITPATEVDFLEQKGHVYLVKKKENRLQANDFENFEAWER